MRQEREEIAQIFLDHFKKRGYAIQAPSELITSDKTLLFTNDTITPWKGYLVTNTVPEQGVCMKQPCLRLQGLKDTICEENSLELMPRRFLGYFNALGILTKKPVTEVETDVLELLLNEYELNDSTIKVYAQHDMPFLKKVRTALEVCDEPHPAVYYRWKYGLEGIVGLGATFMLSQSDGTFQEIGQLIELQDQNGNLLGYEFGFGAETFLSRKRSDETYAAWPICGVIEEEHLRFKTLLDNYSCFGAMLSIPKGLMTARHAVELRKTAKNVALLQDTFGISLDWSETVLNNFLSVEFSKSLDHDGRSELVAQMRAQEQTQHGLY